MPLSFGAITMVCQSFLQMLRADHDSTAVIASFSNGVWQTNRSENAHVCIPDAVINGAPRLECSILAENGSIYAKADPSRLLIQNARQVTAVANADRCDIIPQELGLSFWELWGMLRLLVLPCASGPDRAAIGKFKFEVSQDAANQRECASW